MEAQECHKILWILIKPVVGQRARRFAERLPFRKGPAQGIEEREIKEGIDSRIHAIKASSPTLEKGNQDRVSIKHFTDHP